MFKEKSKSKNKIGIKDMILCSIFAALYAVGAFIQIPLPNSDYFTLQYLFIILAAMTIGSRRAPISVLVYLATGLAGFPVFAAGGGITYVLKPSFGYLIGFAIASFVIATIIERSKNYKFVNFFLAGLTGFLIIYAIGFIYKYAVLNMFMGIETPWILIFISAFPIDIPGDFLATILASIIAPKIRKAVKINDR